MKSVTEYAAPFFLELGAKLDQVGHVHFGHDEEMRGGCHALGKPLRNDLPHLAHRLQLLRGCALGIRHARALNRREAGLFLCLQVGLHVLFNNASAGAGAGNLRGIDAGTCRRARRHAG